MVFESIKEIILKNFKFWSSLKPSSIPSSVSIPKKILNQYFNNASSVFDFGCGVGNTLKELDNNNYLKLVGYDLNKNAIEVAETKKFNNIIEFYSDESTFIQMKDTFEIINMKAVLSCIYGIQERINILKKLKEKLLDNGKIIIIDFFQNEEIEYYKQRYIENEKITKEYGTFLVKENNGKEMYYSHHFSQEELRFIAEQSNLDIMHLEEDYFTSRSGNNLKGFVLILTKNNSLEEEKI